MKSASDYRITDIQRATVNGTPRKLFRAYERKGDAFIHIGQFSAHPMVPDKNLWKHIPLSV